MLDKIKDIQLNLNGSKTEYYTGQYKRNNPKKDLNYTDTLSCSEAVQYIMQKKWQIKELFLLSSQRVSITFSVVGIEFHSIIDTGEINKLSKIDYSISSEKDINEIKKKLTAFISMDIIENNFNRNIENELPGIKMLFKRLFSLNIENELNSDDSMMLDSLFDDILEFISFDLSYINFSLFEFITKLTGSKINISTNNIYPSITLNKIKVAAA